MPNAADLEGTGVDVGKGFEQAIGDFGLAELREDDSFADAEYDVIADCRASRLYPLQRLVPLFGMHQRIDLLPPEVERLRVLGQRLVEAAREAAALSFRPTNAGKEYVPVHPMWRTAQRELHACHGIGDATLGQQRRDHAFDHVGIIWRQL